MEAKKDSFWTRERLVRELIARGMVAESNDRGWTIVEDRGVIARAALQAAELRELAALAKLDEAVASLREIGGLLAANGCDCECGHHWSECDEDCEKCLACRVGAALGKEEA